MAFTRIDIDTIAAEELIRATHYQWAMATKDIGCNRIDDLFMMFDLSSPHERDQETLLVSCSTPERLLAHFKGYVANRMGVAA